MVAGATKRKERPMMTSMDTKIIVVVDNKAGEGLASEHGLSLWIETEGKRILFDTGQGPALESNARALGIDLSTADILVLSHGHYDHAGGIAYVIEQARDIDVYCHPAVVQPRYVIRDGKASPIGMPRGAGGALEQLPSVRLHWVLEPLMLTETVGVTGPVPRLTNYEDTGGPFYLNPEGARPDLIEDDLALWIQTGQGLVVCVGCAHAGLINTLHHIRDVTGGARVRAVIGGFHLLSASHERLTQSIVKLRLLEPDMLVPCHCTGESAVASLCDALGGRVSTGASGMTFLF
jgi:7,8-dihydropterin-6-yl-methyl-4-(beta-D-ribofuranosyl)aminobenzene 5'-phosphate synthase